MVRHESDRGYRTAGTWRTRRGIYRRMIPQARGQPVPLPGGFPSWVDQGVYWSCARRILDTMGHLPTHHPAGGGPAGA